MTTTLAVVDFSGVFWTYLHATADETQNIAVEKTVNYVAGLLRDFDHLALCVDKPPYHRAQVFPAYKAHRPAKSHEHIDMMRRAAKDLRARGVHTFGADGFEADDLLATFVEWHWAPIEADEPPRFDSVTLVTCDKDCWQLLTDDRVTMLNFTNGTRTTEADLKTRHDIKPIQVPDWLALCGDKVDGIPGVNKCGPKAASWLLAEFTDIPGILNMLDKHPTLMGGKKSLAAGLYQAAQRMELNPGVESPRYLEFWRDLAKLDANAPIDCEKVYAKSLPTIERDPEVQAVVDDIQPKEPMQDPREQDPPAPTPSGLVMEQRAKELELDRAKEAKAESAVVAAMVAAPPPPPPKPEPVIKMSNQWGELAGAMAKAQLGIQKVIKDNTAKVQHKGKESSHTYSYASLADVREACRPFHENGIAIVQMPGSEGLKTLLIHSSGQWLSCITPLQYNGGGPQAYGSAVTYACRYALTAVAGIPVDDDDGAAAQARYSNK